MATQAGDLDFKRHGAFHYPGVISRPEAQELANKLEPQLDARPGVRLQANPRVSELLLAGGPVGRIAAELIGHCARPVRAVLFDKNPASNWIVAWHQDRTIAVRARLDVRGFGPWSTKDGILHVAPPGEILAGMVTLRLHLDPVDTSNAPLIVALGSHRLGRVDAYEAAKIAADHQQYVCEAGTGDVWAYSTPILHMSARSQGDRRRRVLQVDYAAEALPEPLEWLGIAV